MSNITLYVPENVKQKMGQYSEIKWSEIVRKAILTKLKEMRKYELLRKYVEKEQFTKQDLQWMDENDWHPVDEKQMKLSFIKDLQKKKKFTKVKNIDEIFE